MNRKLLLLSLCVSLSSAAQTSLFVDDFNGGSSNWILNSTDLNSSSNKNQWIVNNNYTGANFPNTCYQGAHNTPATIVSQPSGISNANGNYLHIISNSALANGVLNANFESGTSDCPNTEETFVKMAAPVSTIGYTNVEFSFWVLKGNSDPGYRGTAYYSLDGGSTWVAFVSNINNYTNWTKITETNALWDNQTSVSFAFSFTNNFSFYNGIIPMAVDDVKITGDQAPTLTVNQPASTEICFGSSTSINVALNSNYNANTNNAYEVYLSDATGSFANEILVGSTNSNAVGSINVSCTIPDNLPAGNAYRLRAKSTSPAITSETTIAFLQIHLPQTITFAVSTEETVICQGQTITITANGAADYLWNTNEEGNTLTITPDASTTYTVQGTDANGCQTDGEISIEVEDCLAVNEINQIVIQILPNPVKSEMTLSNINGLQQVEVVDLTGRLVRILNPNHTIWSLDDLNKGSYILHLISENSIFNIPFVKE